MHVCLCPPSNAVSTITARCHRLTLSTQARLAILPSQDRGFDLA